jgi:hypothetical protein
MIMRQTATHNIQEKSKDLRDLPDHEVQDLDNHHITKSYIFHLVCQHYYEKEETKDKPEPNIPGFITT